MKPGLSGLGFSYTRDVIGHCEEMIYNSVGSLQRFGTAVIVCGTDEGREIGFSHDEKCGDSKLNHNGE